MNGDTLEQALERPIDETPQQNDSLAGMIELANDMDEFDSITLSAATETEC